MSMEVLPDPTPERAPDGGIILQTTSGGRRRTSASSWPMGPCIG